MTRVRSTHGDLAVFTGQPYPLGATWDGLGVNFALFSENATHVELCLFDSPDSTSESVSIEMPEQTDQVWHTYVRDMQPGQLYGYRVHGAYKPEHGHRFNAAKVLLDPYAKAIGRNTRWSDANFGYDTRANDDGRQIDKRDNAAFAPLGMVVDTAYAWGDDKPLRTPWHDTLIYELHVKGFTQLHPEIPEALRGTYAGLASDPAIQHFKRLGVTAVELMPVHHHLNDRRLFDAGLSNYWGYNTLSFLAPDSRYAGASDPLDSMREFKSMVQSLHAAGIEVILDVVYNHTAEGNHLGPTLSMRGIDNAAYYRLSKDPRYYMDFTGTGNTLNMMHPRVLQLIMDSLRYWVQEMHVDGFRFDLASALARELYEVDKLGAFFDIIHQDPIISRVKLIAEPWDLGEGGYQVGNFPVLWTEWNGKYRDTVRSFWRGDDGAVSELATRITGSADLYAHSGKRPHASINFVTSHDGFTLADLVSYNDKHNEANHEGNRDGDDHNLSWNCGVEGPTNDPEIRELRERQRRNFIATLLLSQGVPMIAAGDELGKTQRGNNNAYCQDNEISWIDWGLDEVGEGFLSFVEKVLQIRRENRALRRRRFLHGERIRGADIKDITWFTPVGYEMEDDDWSRNDARVLIVRLVREKADYEEDEANVPNTLTLAFNSLAEPIPFRLPPLDEEECWELLLDTAAPDSEPCVVSGGGEYELEARAVAVLRLIPDPGRQA